MIYHLRVFQKSPKELRLYVIVILMILCCFAASGKPSYAAAKGTDVTVKIGKTNFRARFNNSKASKKLLAKMPFRLTMAELNGNEKYKYLGYDLPSKEKQVKKIHAGDIMLYGTDCLVVFYKDFRTSYPYTRIGRITNPAGLKKVLGKGKVKVGFRKTDKKPALNKRNLTLKTGQTYVLKLKNAKASKVKWSVGNKKIVNVKAGKVKAKKAGKTNIIARYHNKRYKCLLTVTSAEAAAVGSEPDKQSGGTEPDPDSQPVDIKQDSKDNNNPANTKEMSIKIGDRELLIDWEENDSVRALEEQVSKGSLQISMSIYGDFEQVGNLGTTLPRNDIQMTTSPGDIVLYSGNKIVIFYGSNSWSYTRLGRVKGLTSDELHALLGNGNVMMTIQ